MGGENLRQTHSLFFNANTLGISSPTTIVTALKGMTTNVTPITSDAQSPNWSFSGAEISSAAPCPPVAAAMAPTSVMPNCSVARLASMFCFITSAAFAPLRCVSASALSRLTEILAKAIS
jgi:hypothetical protein